MADWGSGNIYKFTPTGTRSTFASGLAGPNGLTFDGSGDLFEADSNSNNIYEFTPTGTRSTFASGLSFPRDLAFDRSGNLFESDVHSGDIYEFTPGGVRSTFASGLNSPEGLAFDGRGNLFETDASSGNIYEFTPSGTRSTFVSGLVAPGGLAFDGSGNLYVSSVNLGTIYEFTPAGSQSTFGSSGSSGLLAFDSSGNLFDGDAGGSIYEFTPSGTRSTFASGLVNPAGLAFAPTPTPEPSTLVLFAVGAIVLVGYSTKRNMSTKAMIRGLLSAARFRPLFARGAAHIALSTIVLALGQTARAGNIKYNIVNYPLSQSDTLLGGTVRLSGTLITNGTIGELSSSDVIGGSLTYVDGAANVHVLPFSSATDPYDFTFGDVSFHVPFLVATANKLSIPLGGGGTIEFGGPRGVPLPYAVLQYSNDEPEDAGLVTYFGEYFPIETLSSPGDSSFSGSAVHDNPNAGAGSIFGSNSWVIANGGTAVPEPSSFLLAATSGVAFFLLFTRRAR